MDTIEIRPLGEVSRGVGHDGFSTALDPLVVTILPAEFASLIESVSGMAERKRVDCRHLKQLFTVFQYVETHKSMAMTLYHEKR